ncbi:hypothetical protein Tco_0465390 [Tanacetum coccineum]
MTRSSTKELFKPYEEPERVLHSTRKLFKTTSLDYSSSPEFNLFSDLEDQCEKEVTESIGEPTIEEYMTKTQEDYGSGIARPKIDEKHENEHIKKVLKIVDLLHIPEVNQDQIMFRVFSMSLTGAANRWLRNEPEVILFYKGLDVPTRQIFDSKGAIPSMKAADAKKAIQDMADHSKKWHNGTSTRTRSTDTFDGLAAIQAQLNNLGKEIKKEDGKTLEEVYYTQFGVPFPKGGRYRAVAPGFYQRDNGNPSYQERRQRIRLIDNNYEEKEVLSELIDKRESATNLKRLLREKPRMGYQIEASVGVHDSAILEDSLLPKEKDPRSFTILCLSELAPTKLIIELADRTIKCPTGLRERMELDLEAMLMREALILNRSLDPNYGDYIELNDLNEPLELRKNQVEDLGPTIKDEEVINEPIIGIVKTRNDDEEIEGIDEYPSFCDFDRKIHIDYAYNLQFSCMIGFEHVNAKFFPILSINVMSKRFYISIMKDKIVYRGKNVVEAFMNVPIFGNRFVEKYVLKQDDLMDSLPLVKVSTYDKLNGISDPYQKLKSFYKGVLDLGPEYIRDAKTVEWLTHGHRACMRWSEAETSLT